MAATDQTRFTPLPTAARCASGSITLNAVPAVGDQITLNDSTAEITLIFGAGGDNTESFEVDISSNNIATIAGLLESVIAGNQSAAGVSFSVSHTPGSHTVNLQKHTNFRRGQ